MELGRQYATKHPQRFDELVAATDPTVVAIILYTSGTTGRPKGVCLTHEAFIKSAQGAIDVEGLTPDDDVLSYLPPAWGGAFRFSFPQCWFAGFTFNCTEAAATLSKE